MANIMGTSSSDILYGRAGNDVLTGGAGDDIFVFDTALSSTTNVDYITDFTPGADQIWLDSAIFSKLGAAGALNASMFHIGSAAADSDDYIIYNKNTGALIYDSNGNASGEAINFAKIGKGLALTSSDFKVIEASSMDEIPTTGLVTKTGTGSDILSLKITQDYYNGDAKYEVYVDGQKSGDTFTAKALHGSGQFDTLEIKGDWGASNHNVEVKFLNDLYGGTVQTDRNLYVEGATYNGVAVSGSSLSLYTASTKAFTFTDGDASPASPTPTDTDDVVSPTSPTPTTAPTDGVHLTKITTSVKSASAGQVIENLDIYVDSGDALQITHDNVTVRNVRIHHKTGDGISVNGADGVTIQNVEVINSDPPVGQNPETSAGIININTYQAADLTIDNVTVRGGSSGIYLLESPRATITDVDGYNFYGPFPRGQFVQFNKSPDGLLQNFYTLSPANSSWTEDNVSVYYSPNVTVRDGVIDGNNSPSGVGVMFEGTSDGGKVINVDTIHMGNGAFSSYSNNVTFEDARTFDGILANQGRGLTMSNGLSWNHSGTGISILDSTYTNPANPRNISWGETPAVVKDISQDAAATPMAHITNDWNWIL